ncbi:MAG: DUF4251 domain-containing protein [Bacteroidales bacterium]|nr:DUF4251 domain-containing protein [Bacteroidales bacterium]
MKKIIIILAVFVIPVCISGQDDGIISKEEQRELAKEKRKAEKLAENQKAIELTKLMLDYQRFVLEANYVSGKSGQRYIVSPNLNFMYVDSTEAVLQLGNPWGVGINGVGGITLDGTVKKYEVVKKENKRGISYSVSMFIITHAGTYDIHMWVTQSGKADATVRGSTSGQLTYSGDLVPLSLSKVYKGNSFP